MQCRDIMNADADAAMNRIQPRMTKKIRSYHGSARALEPPPFISPRYVPTTSQFACLVAPYRMFPRIAAA